MKTVIIYRPMSEFARAVEEFVHEYSRRFPDRRLEILDVDSRDGSALMSLYDIFSHPAIIAMQDDGSVSQLWQGERLPLLDEVAGYAPAGSFSF